MLDDFKAWLDNPFRPDMGAAGWFGWIGLLIACFALWSIIIKRISEI